MLVLKIYLGVNRGTEVDFKTKSSGHTTDVLHHTSNDLPSTNFYPKIGRKEDLWFVA